LPLGLPTMAAAKFSDNHCCTSIVCCIDRLSPQPKIDVKPQENGGAN
jgi:hypothetical protein